MKKKEACRRIDNLDYYLQHYTPPDYSERDHEAMMMAKKALEQEPKKGHWIMTHDYFTGAYESIDYVRCSCCHGDSLEEGNYCPNCGAEMSEVEE